jgi:hypothetical protein
MNFFERMIFTLRGGKYREFQGLTTHFEPKDIILYRKLLPEFYTLPDHPIVTIFLADYVHLLPWPLTRYQEWTVQLKSEWNSEEGWYPITMPVSKWLAMNGGRYFGFPKYIADEISLTKINQNYIAYSKYKNKTQLKLEFHPGYTRELTPWEKELAENESFFKGSSHLLVPPGSGPRAQKISLQHVIPPKWSPEHGMVHVQVDPSESWKGLVPDLNEFPGTYNHFVGGYNLIAERLN